jgi:hypothetical protein
MTADLPALAPCVAGLRTALADASAAVERWCEERVGPMEHALGDAAQSLSRARRMANEVCATIPSHSRRGRRVLRAVEQVSEALRLVERARVWDWDEEEEGSPALVGHRSPSG